MVFDFDAVFELIAVDVSFVNSLLKHVLAGFQGV